MKTLCTGLTMVALLALAGCTGGNTSEHHAGGPGVTNASQKAPLVGEADNTFEIPPASVSLKQGESKDVTLKIKRGKNFDKDVTLKFGKLPKDVEITPASPVIKHSDTGVTLTVKALDTATPNDNTVEITGEGGGKDAKTTLDIKVSKK